MKHHGYVVHLGGLHVAIHRRAHLPIDEAIEEAHKGTLIDGAVLKLQCSPADSIIHRLRTPKQARFTIVKCLNVCNECKACAAQHVINLVRKQASEDVVLF